MGDEDRVVIRVIGNNLIGPGDDGIARAPLQCQHEPILAIRTERVPRVVGFSGAVTLVESTDRGLRGIRRAISVVVVDNTSRSIFWVSRLVIEIGVSILSLAAVIVVSRGDGVRHEAIEDIHRRSRIDPLIRICGHVYDVTLVERIFDVERGGVVLDPLRLCRVNPRIILRIDLGIRQQNQRPGSWIDWNYGRPATVGSRSLLANLVNSRN